MPALVLLSTTADADAAERIARALVEERLAACVQLDPVRSVYRWNGAVEDGDEVRVTAKTVAARAGAAMARIAALHPYDLPKLLSATVEADDAYAGWVAGEVA